MSDGPDVTSVDGLVERLQELHQRTQETPLFNPVFQLAHELSRHLEAGDIDLARMEALVTELECEALQSRSRRLRRMVGPVGQPHDWIGSADSFDEFRMRWEVPQLHAVFTAHPTFLLTPQQSAAVAQAAEGDSDIGQEACVAPHERPQITLDYEHARALRAIANAQDARDAMVARLLETAQAEWPEDWHRLAPLPFRFASWVGYDMDGRTDIKWYTSIAFRLSEKAERLARYAASLEAIDAQHPLLATLRGAADYSSARADDFRQDLSEPADLTAAANRLTSDDPHKLLSLGPVIERLRDEARSAKPERAIALKVLVSAMEADGLGMGWIHFRVNSSQLHNAIRRRIDPDNTLDLASKGAIAALRDILKKVRRRSGNS